MKILIIGNPIASGGDGEKRIRELQSILESRGHVVEPYLTQFAGDGKNRMSQVSADIDRVVVVGGDGTVNEIINGIPDGFSTPILQMPTGNANILAQDLNLPEKALEVADVLEKGRVVMADVAEMNGERFIMIAGAGFDARVTEEVKKVRTGKVSNLSYVVPILRSLKNHSQSMFDVVVDGTKRARGAIVLVCNVRNYAGLCEIAFDAGVDTGQLDVVVFPRDNLLSFLKYLACAKLSRVTRLAGVTYLKGRSVEISSDKSIPVELDGDFNGRHSGVTIKLKPACVPLMVP